MNRFLNFTKNFLITAAILVCGFLLSLFMQKEWGNQTLIPSIFLLDVFLVSVITDGFLYGAVAFCHQHSGGKLCIYISVF